MIYVDRDLFERLLRSEEEAEYDLSQQFFKEEIIFDSSEDDCDSDFDSESYGAACQEFVTIFMDRIIPVCLDFYPHLRSKRKKLKEELVRDGENAFETLFEAKECYIEGKFELDFVDADPNEVDLNEIIRFPRNKKFDHLLENYEAWYKQKISFENIYVESFYAAAYIKNIHSVLINIAHEYYPVMKSLPAEKLDNIYVELKNDAWDIYNTVIDVDPDELNKSSILYDLEDYEYEDLINFRGPEILRDAQGRISQICISRNKPKPDKVPPCCCQCKYFNDPKYENILCGVCRFSQRDSESFSCRAFEMWQG